MKPVRVIRWTAVCLVGAMAAGLGGLYLLSVHKPGDYRPRTLTTEQKQQALAHLEGKLADLFGRSGAATAQRAEEPEGDASFTMTVTQEELNEWVASLPDPTLAQLSAAGLADPAAAIGEDRLTFYAFWKRYNRVVGIDLQFLFDSQGRMTLKIRSVRLGQVPMPEKLLKQHLENLRQHIQAELDKTSGMEENDRFAGLSVKEYRRWAAGLLKALNGEPVIIDVPKQFGNVRLMNVELEPGLATLHARPLEDGAAPATPVNPPRGG